MELGKEFDINPIFLAAKIPASIVNGCGLDAIITSGRAFFEYLTEKPLTRKAQVSIFIILAIPDIFPRLSEINVTSQRRVRIWNEAMPFIKENFLWGRGFLSYYQYAGLNPSIYQTTHTHNFAIEALISFGLVGSFLLLWFLWSYYRKVTECKELLRNNTAVILILSISTAVLVHTMTDLTLLWVQTGLLYALILGGVGIDEDALTKRIIACASLGGASDRKEEK